MKCRSEYDQLEEYFELLKLRGVKADTISRYRSCMVSLFRKMESLGIVVDLKTMKQEDIYRALLHMDLMESSQEAYGYIIKAACRYHMNPNIEGLNTTGYTSLTFTFGLYCMTGSFDPSQLTLYAAEAGSAEDGTPLSYSYQSGSNWMLCTVSSSIPTSDNLRLRLISNGAFRIDDLTLSGIKQ